MDIAALGDEVEMVSALCRAARHCPHRRLAHAQLGVEVGELTRAYLAGSGRARDKGHNGEQLEEDFRAELSDVLAQVLLIAQR